MNKDKEPPSFTLFYPYMPLAAMGKSCALISEPIIKPKASMRAYFTSETLGTRAVVDVSRFSDSESLISLKMNEFRFSYYSSLAGG